MKEQLITLDTAKLAKEKGFDLDLPIRYFRIGTKIVEAHIAFADNADEELGQAPTQSLLQKWLREVHRINVEVNYFDNNYWVIGTISHINKYFNTYEEALEYGLKQTLKLIQ